MSARRRCPICGTELDLEAAPARRTHGAAGSDDAGAGARSAWPFCSARCRMIDLGRWLGEAYRLPDRPGVDEPYGSEHPGAGGVGDGDDELLH